MPSKHPLLLLLLWLMAALLSSCYRDRAPSRFQLKDTLEVADTLTAAQIDSISFAHQHHYSENFNFVVRTDSIWLCNQQPEEVAGGLSTDSFAVVRGTRVVVADIRILPSDSIDSVWVQIATENYDFGWSREGVLLQGVDPDDPISQFISTFSDVHTLIFLVVFILIGVAYLMRKLLRQNARLVHFNDIPSFYPTALAITVAGAATVYASIQLFAPDIWREFYFHPSLNPFFQPMLLRIFLLAVWSLLIIGLATVDDVLRHLRFDEALLYLCGLAAVCAFNYILFSISTLYYVGYLLFVVYVVLAVWAYRRHVSRYVCGHCGSPLRCKGRCPACGTVNE